MPFRICSFYHHLLFCRNNLCFDRTDLWFRSNESQSKQPSIELTFGFDRNNLRSNWLVTLSLLYPWNGLNVVVQHNKYCCNHWIIAYLMLLSRTHRHIDVFKDTKDRQDTAFFKPKQSSNSENWSNDRSTLVLNSTFSHLQFKRTPKYKWRENRENLVPNVENRWQRYRGGGKTPDPSCSKSG